MNPKAAIIPPVGVHYGVPPETYHSWHALSHSWLNRLRISPAHLLDVMENGWDTSTPAEQFGQAVHVAVLEPGAFDTRYATRPEGQSGTTKDGREFSREARDAGLSVLNHADRLWIDAIVRRAQGSPRVSEWMRQQHQTEVSLVWERDGYLCKARLDMIVPGPSIIVDLKTTITASPEGFAAQCARYRYGNQASWYLDGLQRLTDKVWDFSFLACEKKRPFLVSVHGFKRGSVAHDLAVFENNNLFDLYRECLTTRTWRGYGDVDEIILPKWALEESERIETEEPF